MAACTRQTMRLLSPRLQPASTSRAFRVPQIRHATTGRYSKPATSQVDLLQSFASKNATADPLSVRQEILDMQKKRAYHSNRMRMAGLGLLGSMAMTLMIVYNLDLDQMEKTTPSARRSGQQLDASNRANEEFQGKEVHVLGIGSDKKIIARGDGEEIDLVETGTSSVPHFPRTIYLPASSESDVAPTATGLIQTAAPNTTTNPGNIANQEEYTLVGLGIRTVLFIQVYVVGLYVRTQDISSLQEKLIHSVNQTASTLVPSEKDDLKKKLLDPVQSRELWSELLKVPGLKTAWRISPTRNTDFGHLRDGFVNGINARIQEARRLKPGEETEFDAEEFGKSVQELKGVFAGGKASKGSVLILARDRQGQLDVLFQANPEKARGRDQMEHLGAVGDERISRLVWLGYLAGEKVSSKAAREGVADGCITFATRPIGSVEARVI